jgi:hypothetical protein
MIDSIINKGLSILADKSSMCNNKNACSGCAKLKKILGESGKGNVGIRITFTDGSEFPPSQLSDVSLDQCKLAIFERTLYQKPSLRIFNCSIIKFVKVFVGGSAFIIKF